MAEIPGTLIVDGANWAHTLGEKRVKFEKLVTELQNRTGVTLYGLIFWGTYRTEQDVGKRWGFFNYLKDLGWYVNAIPAMLGEDKRWRDKTVDINIALDAYEEALTYHTNPGVGAIMIGSGDGDFAAVINRYPDKIQAYTVCFRNNYASELRKISKVIFLEDLGVIYDGGGPSMGSAALDQGWETEREDE